MHQIYSCNDENLEVFTVISSKCEYQSIKVIAGALGFTEMACGGGVFTIINSDTFSAALYLLCSNLCPSPPFPEKIQSNI